MLERRVPKATIIDKDREEKIVRDFLMMNTYTQGRVVMNKEANKTREVAIRNR